MIRKSRRFSLYVSLLPPHVAFDTSGTSRKVIVLVWAIRIIANPLTVQTYCSKKHCQQWTSFFPLSKVHINSEKQQNYYCLTDNRETYIHRKSITLGYRLFLQNQITERPLQQNQSIAALRPMLRAAVQKSKNSFN